MTKLEPVQGANTLAAAWDRFVTVATSDEEDARVGRLFNVMMVLTVAVMLLLATVFIIAVSQGLVSTSQVPVVVLLFPLSLAALSGYSFVRSKRGWVRAASRLFIWINFGAVVIVTLIIGGLFSPGWLLFLWPVTLGGMFLRPAQALLMAVGVAVYYAFLWLLTWLVGYTPPLALSLAAFRFLNLTVGLVMVVFVGGVVSYLNVQSLRKALTRLRATSRDLSKVQRTLESRIAERTSALQVRAEQLETIAELNRVIAASSDLRSLLDTAVRLIAERLEYDHVGIFLIDPHNVWAVLRAASSEGGQRMLARGHRLRVGEQGIVGYVAQTGLPRFAFSVGEDAVWFNNPDLPDTQSEISLPLIARGQHIVGVLDIQTTVPSAFTEEDVEVLRILAGGIAVAIANMQAMEETNAAVERLERYQAQDAMQAWRRTLARRQMRVGYAYESGLVNRVDSAPQAAGAVREVTTRTTEDGKHLLLAPIRVRDRDMGVLTFEKAVPWTEDQVQLARFVVGQLDLALDNARLLEETRLRANQERARSDIVSRIRAMTSTDAILRNAARELGVALQVERSRIQLLPPGEGRVDGREA